MRWAQAQALTPGIRTRRISHPRTKPFLRMCMPGVCACACAYLTSVNQALLISIPKILNFPESHVPGRIFCVEQQIKREWTICWIVSVFVPVSEASSCTHHHALGFIVSPRVYACLYMCMLAHVKTYACVLYPFGVSISVAVGVGYDNGVNFAIYICNGTRFLTYMASYLCLCPLISVNVY